MTHEVPDPAGFTTLGHSTGYVNSNYKWLKAVLGVRIRRIRMFWASLIRIRIRWSERYGSEDPDPQSGSVPKCHGSRTLAEGKKYFLRIRQTCILVHHGVWQVWEQRAGVPVSPLYPPPTACQYHRRRRPFRRAHRRSCHRQLCRRPGRLRREIR